MCFVDVNILSHFGGLSFLPLRVFCRVKLALMKSEHQFFLMNYTFDNTFMNTLPST